MEDIVKHALSVIRDPRTTDEIRMLIAITVILDKISDQLGRIEDKIEEE